MIRNEQELQALLATPSSALIEDMAKVKGDILVLGAGGKMGPTLCILAANAIKAAGTGSKVIAVSRFSNPAEAENLRSNGVEVLPCDLFDDEARKTLPQVPNVIYMVGRKFGTQGSEGLTWMVNVHLPALVAKQFSKSNIVAFSSGNIYPMLPPGAGGASEETPLGPIGEYAISCMGRERVFAQCSLENKTPVAMYRLNYAVEPRYGVLCDIAQSLLNDEPISLDMGSFNCIWQGSANEIALRMLLQCQSPVHLINVTGPETVSVEYAANYLGKLLGKTPHFVGTPGTNALLSNASHAISLFGYPTKGIHELMDMQAHWLLNNGATLGKPTHFEQKGGIF